MIPLKSHASLLLPTFLFLTFISSSHGAFRYLLFQTLPHQEIVDGKELGKLVSLEAKRHILQDTSGGNSTLVVENPTLVLAAERTNRKDPLDGYKKYTGGWNISDQHYWASVSFTAVPLFVVAIVWFLVFGLILMLMCCRHCCCRREPYGYSRTAYALSLIFLILFTAAAIIGSIALYTGQGKFHRSTTDTLGYVVKQANVTIDNLRGVSDVLSTAKRVGVNNIFLGSDVQTKIDQIGTKINIAIDSLANRTKENSDKIQSVLDGVRVSLIVLAAIMLVLTFLGFLLSVLGMQSLVYILVIVGWILITGTFILSGVFLLLHNVVEDACVSMDEWVQHPAAHTALDDLLPCVDAATANETFFQTKQVTYLMADVVNQVITNVSNLNFSPNFRPFYYNQSGPLVPILCNPFHPDNTERICTDGEVALSNATEVWQNYVCQVSGAGICTTVGRLTPDLFNQMSSAVTVSYGLHRYGPFLVDLVDCTFVRQAFATISDQYCPGLDRYSKRTYTGLVMASAAVMLSLIFWVIYSRERRHRVYTRQFVEGPKD